MSKPITTTAGGVCFAFPNVCKTPAPSGTVPIPYPSVGTLDDSMKNVSEDVFAQGFAVVKKDSEIENTVGDQAGSALGVTSNSVGGAVKFATASQSVLCNGEGVVRMFDTTEQNVGASSANAVGVVLGGVPTVLVGD